MSFTDRDNQTEKILLIDNNIMYYKHTCGSILFMFLYLSQRSINYVLVDVFGEVAGSTYTPLEDNTVLTSDTTLYCVTENKNTPEVMWSYVDVAGTSTDLTSTTDASTGVSTIQVSTTQPGYYSCEVTENGGSSRMYTAVMTDSDPDTSE